MFLQWLNEQADFYRRNISTLILKDQIDMARTATGGLKAYEEIVESLTVPDEAAPEEVDEPFVDAATRFSLRAHGTR